MSFKRMLSENSPKEVILFIILVVIFMVAISIIMEDGDFVESSMNTSTHYYNTPRPDPSREIDYFDHEAQVFRYKDERVIEIPRNEPRIIYHRTKQQRLMDEWVKALRDDIRDEIEMDLDQDIDY